MVLVNYCNFFFFSEYIFEDPEGDPSGVWEGELVFVRPFYATFI